MQQPERWTSIRPHIDVFTSLISPSLPPVELVAANDRTWTTEEYKRLRPRGFPSRMRGVYLLFGPEEVLLYVGLAMGCFDTRIWTHDHLSWRWGDVIPMDDRQIVLAPSLEFFLITRLKPPGNKTYRSYECQLLVDDIPQ